MLPQEHCSNINWFFSLWRQQLRLQLQLRLWPRLPSFLAKTCNKANYGEGQGSWAGQGLHNNNADADPFSQIFSFFLYFLFCGSAKAAKINYDIMIYKISRKWCGLFSPPLPSHLLPPLSSCLLAEWAWAWAWAWPQLDYTHKHTHTLAQAGRIRRLYLWRNQRCNFQPTMGKVL